LTAEDLKDLGVGIVGHRRKISRMDPEDLREVISAYQKCVAHAVQHFGGFVAKYMGDGVLVYFGFYLIDRYDVRTRVGAGSTLGSASTKPLCGRLLGLRRNPMAALRLFALIKRAFKFLEVVEAGCLVTA
jgi:hypothetical protein